MFVYSSPFLYTFISKQQRTKEHITFWVHSTKKIMSQFCIKRTHICDIFIYNEISHVFDELICSVKIVSLERQLEFKICKVANLKSQHRDIIFFALY